MAKSFSCFFSSPVFAISTVLILGVLLAGPVYAGWVGPDETNKVKNVLDHPVDDDTVTLQGHIIKKVGDERYLFSDETGEIVAEIEEEEFPPDTITPETPVEIRGEVDKAFFEKPEIEVDFIRVIKNSP